MSNELKVEQTPIPGLLTITIPVHGDARGWFKENWQREKMVAAGLPDFGPVQNNVSFNAQVGVTRGIHAEPWDKFISVASGRVFGAWVDVREGDTFGVTYWREITPDIAIFVPRGVGNAFQTLDAPATYTYLVNDHWSAERQGEYTFVNLADETLNIPWPIPPHEREVSAQDLDHPPLEQVKPMPRPRQWRAHSEGTVAPPAPDAPHKPSSSVRPRGNDRVLIVGQGGQLSRALAERWLDEHGAVTPLAPARHVRIVGRDQLDLASLDSIRAFDFSPYDLIVNAAAYTAVDAAESAEGRRDAWAVNVTGVAALVAGARSAGASIIHVSSDYVFDGSFALHAEDEEFAPLGVYGQTKAAGDAVVAGYERHYIVRTSWVVGQGKNFVTTMAALARGGVDPSVVHDQVGRLSFASEIARAIEHLVRTGAEFGTYNVSNSGDSASWFDLARFVFEALGHDPERVSGVSTVEYFGDKTGVAPRPLNSTFLLDKIEATGFTARDQFEALSEYLRTLEP